MKKALQKNNTSGVNFNKFRSSKNERLKNAYSKEQGNAERLTQENNSLRNKMQEHKQFTGFLSGHCNGFFCS